MARARNQKNGRLEEAMTNLLQTQALFLGQLADINHRIDQRFARMDERIARIEAILVQHGQILNEHTRILQALPEAVREKIGFKVRE
jgi:hypothetical protein